MIYQFDTVLLLIRFLKVPSRYQQSQLYHDQQKVLLENQPPLNEKVFLYTSVICTSNLQQKPLNSLKSNIQLFLLKRRTFRFARKINQKNQISFFLISFYLYNMGNCDCKATQSQETHNQIQADQPIDQNRKNLIKSLKSTKQTLQKDSEKRQQEEKTSLGVKVKQRPKPHFVIKSEDQQDNQILDNVVIDLEKQIEQIDIQEIKKTLKNHFIFKQLPQKEIQFIIKKMRYCTAKIGDYIFKQGDKAGAYYIILEGKCLIEVNNEEKKILKFGQSFGDLGIIYKAPRSASVKALKNCQLVQINRKAFNKVMEEINLMYEKQNKKILTALTFYHNLTQVQQNAIAASCLTEIYEEGQVVFNKGDDANSIYIIKKGIVLIQEKNIQLKQGQCFGENCLFVQKTVKPSRSHTLKAKTSLQMISISKQSLINILGDDIKLTLKKNLIKKIIKESKLYLAQLQQKWNKAIDEVLFQPFKPSQIVIHKDSVFSHYIYILLASNLQSNSKKYNVNQIIQIDNLIANEKYKIPEDLIAVGQGFVAKIKRVTQNKQNKEAKDSRTSEITRQQLVQLKDFYVVRELRSGNFGKVIACYNKKTQKLYAVKVLIKKSMQNQKILHYVVSEEEILRTTPHHPFLVEFNKLLKDDTFIYMVMELIQGEDLFDTLTKVKMFDEPRLANYIAQLLDVIQHLHQNKIIYRDIKPQNIMVRRDGYLTLVDMGTAKRLKIQRKFKTNTIIGTPHYMAPQIIMGKGYTFSADLWSLGILIYEVGFGVIPFGCFTQDPFLIYEQIMASMLKYPRNCSKNLKSLLDHLLNKNASQRSGKGIQEIKKLQIFKTINWADLLAKKIKQHYIPPLNTQITKQQIQLSLKDSKNVLSTFCKFQNQDSEINYE